MRKLFTLCFVLAFGIVSAQTTIVSEDFETASGTTAPAGWTRTMSTPSVGFEFGNTGAMSSSYFTIPTHTTFACSNDDAHDDNSAALNVADQDRLITPSMDLTSHASTGVILEFQAFNPETYSSDGTVEVSTNGGSSWTMVYDIPANGAWQSGLVDLSSYTSSSTVTVAFRHNDNAAWASGVCVDDVHIYAPAAYDAEMTALTMTSYVTPGSHNVTGDFTNKGATTITSADLYYSVNGGTPVVDNLTGLSIPTGNSYSFTHTTAASLASVGSYTIDVWVTNVNGTGSDADVTNDSSSTTVSVLSSIPAKKGILMDFTGAWCQFCPDGTAIMDNDVLPTYSDAIGAAVHIGDAMEIADGNTIATEYISGYPSGIIDNYKFSDQPTVEINRGLWVSKMGERLGMVVPCGVSISNQSWNASTRELTVEVKADWVGAASGDFRLNAWVLEDSVTGSGSGYDQVNYYNTTSGHTYFGAGNPIVGFVHNHTVRAMLGGPWGQTGTIPGTVGDGDSQTYTFSFTLPATMDENNIKLVGMVQEHNADADMRQIVNAEEVHLDLMPTAIGNAHKTAEVTKVYPNPFADQTTVQFNINESADVSIVVMDMYGKRIRTLIAGQMNTGTHTVVWDGTDMGNNAVTNGVYMINIIANGQNTVQKVILSR